MITSRPLLVLLLLAMVVGMTYQKLIQFDNNYLIKAKTPFVMQYKTGIFSKDHFPFKRILKPMLRVKVDVLEGNANNITMELYFFNYATFKAIESRIDSHPEKVFCEQGHSNYSALIHADFVNNERQSVKYNVTQNDMYYMVLVRCPLDDQITKIKINGQISLKNPYGYLPGELAGLLIFDFKLTLAYAVIGVVWFVTCVFSRKYLAKIHLAITAVLLLCLLESFAEFIDHVYNNHKGYRNFVFVATSILSELSRKVLSRVLVLLVCMGYGSIKRTLERQVWIGLLLYGLFYYAFCCLNDVAKVLATDDYISESWASLTSVPVALLDAGFYAWVFYSLTVTLVELSKKNQIEKIRLFKKIMFLLVFYVIASIIVFISEGLFGFLNLYSRLWMLYWMFDASFQVIFCIVLCGIMYLLRPSAQSQIFLDSMQISSDAFDDMLDLIDDSDDLNSQNIILGEDEDIDIELQSEFEEEQQRLQQQRERMKSLTPITPAKPSRQVTDDSSPSTPPATEEEIIIL